MDFKDQASLAYGHKYFSALLEGRIDEAIKLQNDGYTLLESIRAEIGEEAYGYCKEDLDGIKL